MKVITVFNELFGLKRNTDEEPNNDCTDFPTRPCRQCGKMDRPQWEGICNDDHCSHFEEPSNGH